MVAYQLKTKLVMKEKLNLGFSDKNPFYEAKLDQKVIEEVTKRTPTFIS